MSVDLYTRGGKGEGVGVGIEPDYQVCHNNQLTNLQHLAVKPNRLTFIIHSSRKLSILKDFPWSLKEQTTSVLKPAAKMPKSEMQTALLRVSFSTDVIDRETRSTVIKLAQVSSLIVPFRNNYHPSDV